MVQVIPKILRPENCQQLISTFEDCVGSGYSERIDNNGTPRFTQVNLNQVYMDVVPFLVQRVKVAIDIYKDVVGSRADYLPKPKQMEEFRVKRYEPETNDRFDEHIDAADYPSARRYLAFLFYLNDVQKGGQTEFRFHGRMIRPEAGSVLVFPPTWEYPHIGLPPISGPKYIMSTYLHYGQN